MIAGSVCARPLPRRESRRSGAPRRRGLGWAGLILASALVTSACRQDMHDQPRFEPFEENPFFADKRSARPHVEGTVPRGGLELDELFFRGTENGEPAQRFPYPVTAEMLERGRRRFDIFCAPCHDSTGSGQGMIVEAGLRQPTSFHDERLRAAPPGYFYGAITNGFGAMFDYADRIDPADRWAIVAYVRALQTSQYAPVDDLPADLRSKLMEGR